MVVNSIPVTFPWMLAIAPSGDLGYVTHGAFTNGVDVINTATNSVVTNIPLPVDVTINAAVTPNGAFVYVTCFSFLTGSKLAVIDTATNSVVAIVPLPQLFAPGIAITPNGAFAYVANIGGANDVSVIDTSSNTEIARVPVAPGPFGVAVTPDGAFVYVTCSFDNRVFVISTATNTLFDFVSVGNRPQGIAFGRKPDDPPPPVDPIEALTDQVEALIASGAFTQDQGDGLLDKIHELSAKLDAEQTGAACNQLSSFVNQVNAFISNGTLSGAQGQVLLDAANSLASKSGCSISG
jgi:YVTN family beta-propeller protein